MQPTLRFTNNLLPTTFSGFEPVTSTLIPFIGSQVLPTLLQTIVIRKGAYLNLIMHSRKRLRHLNTRGVDERGELMDAVNLSIYQYMKTQFF